MKIPVIDDIVEYRYDNNTLIYSKVLAMKYSSTICYLVYSYSGSLIWINIKNVIGLNGKKYKYEV
jgi:hypothetical protein